MRAVFEIVLMPTHYELLGVTVAASLDDIRKAYKRAALKHHPDKGGDEEVFKAVCMAMEILSDDMKRISYDRTIGVKTSVQVPTADVIPTPQSKKDSSWWEGVYVKTKEYVKGNKQQTEPPTTKPQSKFVFEAVRSSFSKVELANASRLKVVSLGMDGVGKSALIKRFCEGRFVDKYITTVGVDYGVKPVEIHNKRIAKINFFDLSGLATFAPVRSEFFPEMQGLMLVFDVGNLASFRAVNDFFNEARSGGRFASVLIGNKIDGNRAVTVEEAKRMADNIGARYYETSAATGEGVNQAMLGLFQSALALADYAKGS